MMSHTWVCSLTTSTEYNRVRLKTNESSSAIKTERQYLYILLGIAGALVGAKVAETLEFNFLGIGAVIGAILGAAFYVIGWRQLKPP
jgi:hypothetical protein